MKNMVITTEALAYMFANTLAKVEITRMVAGAGLIPEANALGATAIAGPELFPTPASKDNVTIIDNTTLNIDFVISNSSMSNNVMINEYGVCYKRADGSEGLFGYIALDTPDVILSKDVDINGTYTRNFVFKIDYSTDIIVGEEANGAYVTVRKVRALINNELTRLLGVNIDKDVLKNKSSITAGNIYYDDVAKKYYVAKADLTGSWAVADTVNFKEFDFYAFSKGSDLVNVDSLPSSAWRRASMDWICGTTLNRTLSSNMAMPLVGLNEIEELGLGSPSTAPAGVGPDFSKYIMTADGKAYLVTVTTGAKTANVGNISITDMLTKKNVFSFDSASFIADITWYQCVFSKKFNKIYVVPYASRLIVIIDLTSMSYKTLDIYALTGLTAPTATSGHWFIQAVEIPDYNMLFMPCFKHYALSPGHVALDMATDTVVVVPTDETGIVSNGQIYDTCTYIQSIKKVLMSSISTSRVYEFDPVSKVVRSRSSSAYALGGSAVGNRRTLFLDTLKTWGNDSYPVLAAIPFETTTASSYYHEINYDPNVDFNSLSKVLVYPSTSKTSFMSLGAHIMGRYPELFAMLSSTFGTTIADDLGIASVVVDMLTRSSWFEMTEFHKHGYSSLTNELRDTHLITEYDKIFVKQRYGRFLSFHRNRCFDQKNRLTDTSATYGEVVRTPKFFKRSIRNLPAGYVIEKSYPLAKDKFVVFSNDGATAKNPYLLTFNKGFFDATKIDNVVLFGGGAAGKSNILTLRANDGGVYVFAIAEKTLVKFDANGQFVSKNVVGDYFYRPQGMWYNKDGSKIIVLNNSSTGMLTVIDTATMAFVKNINAPIALSLPASNFVYWAVKDSSRYLKIGVKRTSITNQEIVRYDIEGEVFSNETLVNAASFVANLRYPSLFANGATLNDNLPIRLMLDAFKTVTQNPATKPTDGGITETTALSYNLGRFNVEGMTVNVQSDASDRKLATSDGNHIMYDTRPHTAAHPAVEYKDTATYNIAYEAPASVAFDKVITHPSLGLRFAFFKRTSGTYGYTSPRTHIAIFNPLSPYNLENAIWIVHPFSTMNYTKAQVKTSEAGSFAVHDSVPEVALDEEFCDVMINEEAMEYYLVTTKNNIYPFFLPDRARDPKVPRSPYIEQGMFHYANN